MGEYAFDERVTGREEVERFVFDGSLPIERADERGAAGDAGETVDERLVAEFDRVGSAAPRSLDREPETGAGGGHDSFVQRIELRRDARQDAGGHIGTIGIAVQLLIRGFP